MKSTLPPGLTRDEYSINGVDTVVYSGGKGPPVVYFHGGGTFHGFEFTRDWTRQFRVILPYHPGFGESGNAPLFKSMGDYVHHYAALFEVLGLDSFAMVGASLGGWLAVEFAAVHNDRVERLVLSSPAGIFMPEHPIPDFAALSPPELASYMITDISVLEPYLPGTEEENARFTADRKREGKSTAQIFQAGMAGPPVDQTVTRVTMPVLLLWGKQDRVVHVDLAQKWLELLPDGRLELIEDVGHLILDESQHACEIAAAFLAGVGPR